MGLGGRVTVIVTPSGHPEAPDGRSQLGKRGQRMSQPYGRVRMLAGRLPERSSGETERGSLTLMLAVLFISLLGLVGLVIDGGAKVTLAENATSVAQEAARAGAGMVNTATAYANGSFVVDETQAVNAADQYLANAGYQGSAEPGATANSIQVTVTVTQPTKVLSLIGIDTMSATGHATATLVTGVTGAGQ
jgi:hypothetical protein